MNNNLDRDYSRQHLPFKEGYERLKKEIKAEDTYNSKLLVFFISAIFLLIISMQIEIPKEYAYIKNILIVASITSLAIAYIFLVTKTPLVDAEKRSFLYAYETYYHLGNYLSSDNKVFRKEEIKKAIRSFIRLRNASNNWRIGNVKIVKYEFGDEYSILKKAIRRKIFRSLKKGDVDDLKKVNSFLFELLIYLGDKKPSKNRLEKVIEKINDIREIKNENLKLLKQINDICEKYPLVKPLIVFLFAISVCGIVFVIANRFGATSGESFIGGVTVSAMILVTYYQKHK